MKLSVVLQKIVNEFINIEYCCTTQPFYLNLTSFLLQFLQPPHYTVEKSLLY